MSKKPRVNVRTANLRAGATLGNSLYDLSGALILAAGFTITLRIKEGLLRRNILEVSVSPEDAARIDTSWKEVKQPCPPKQDPAGVAGPQASVGDQLELLRAGDRALCLTLLTHHCDPYDQQQLLRLPELAADIVSLVDHCLAQVMAGGGRDCFELDNQMSLWIDEVIQDFDHVASYGAGIVPVPQWGELSISKSLLSMLMGIELEFDHQTTREVGICALVHDWGKGWLPERLRRLDEPFSQDDWLEYMKHPLYTAELLSRADAIPANVKLAAPQVHETLTGSGYPNGLHSQDIHPLAKVVAVADTYLAMRTSRRGRPALTAHNAMHFMLQKTNEKLFDARVVRALLNTLSLFPIGSLVKLSDGGAARVLRRNGKLYHHPVVQRVDGPHEPGEIVRTGRNFVDIAVALSNAGEMELDGETMVGMHWDWSD